MENQIFLKFQDEKQLWNYLLQVKKIISKVECTRQDLGKMFCS